MAGVLRRVHVPKLHPGEIALDAAAARHVRSVLRLTEGTMVEIFDDVGAVAAGEIVRLEPAVVVRIGAIRPAGQAAAGEITVASAVPKGDRADWMVEKLSELGCHRFIPLASARSIVLPGGKNKRERWVRIATEAAKQSRRAGVMRIDPLTPLKVAVEEPGREGSAGTAAAAGVFLSTHPSAEPILAALSAAPPPAALTLFIGPEGGWTDDEIALFTAHRLRGVKLTATILRVETAAVAAATVAAVASVAVAAAAVATMVASVSPSAGFQSRQGHLESHAE